VDPADLGVKSRFLFGNIPQWVARKLLEEPFFLKQAFERRAAPCQSAPQWVSACPRAPGQIPAGSFSSSGALGETPRYRQQGQRCRM
jgi:hypothetical protein